jgi:16S rRNA processing protein RimM
VTVKTTVPPDRFVLLGIVTKPHGIQGELKVRPFTETPGNIARYNRLYLTAADGGDAIPCTNVRTRVNGRTVILRLEECATRERAEQLAGMQIWVDSNDLPPIDEDQFYLYTLEGKQAWTEAGEYLGTVRSILSTGGQDILVIEGNGREFLVPVVREFIVALEEDRIVFDLPPGLLEINR